MSKIYFNVYSKYANDPEKINYNFKKMNSFEHGKYENEKNDGVFLSGGGNGYIYINFKIIFIF
jgi:hypothetical protein